jgi:hypothetical protein
LLARFRWAATAVAGVFVAVTAASALLRSPPAKASVAPAAPSPALHAPIRPTLVVHPTPPAPIAALAGLVAAEMAAPIKPDRQTACIAKVVHHESADQPLEGQLAVAQVVINRMRSHRFASTACGVADQPGQFTDIEDFHIPDGTVPWRTALAVARVAQTERAPSVAPGALFFHAAYVRPDWSRRHERVARIADQIFYR